MMYATIAALIFCASLCLWYWLAYNSLVAARNAVDQAWAHIEVELKRRFDLISNLVETARGYARHESETFRKVSELRGRDNPFADARRANDAQRQLNQMVAEVMILAENYPQLRADQSFLKLQGELTETENRIAQRRHAYNETVNIYQNQMESVPSNLVGWVHEFPPRDFFDAPDELADKAPEVKFA